MKQSKIIDTLETYQHPQGVLLTYNICQMGNQWVHLTIIVAVLPGVRDITLKEKQTNTSQVYHVVYETEGNMP